MSERDAVAVYVVDDDEVVLATTGDLLWDAGYEPQMFASPLDFLAAVDHAVPGCLVLDLRMPEMSGIEVLARLNEAGAAIRTILLSGHGDVPRAVAAMRAGALDFVQKPCRSDHLIQAVERAITVSLADHAKAKIAQGQAALASLDLKDRELLLAVSRGEGVVEAGLRLGMDRYEVQAIWERIMDRLGVADAASAAALARQAGLTTEP